MINNNKKIVGKLEELKNNVDYAYNFITKNNQHAYTDRTIEKIIELSENLKALYEGQFPKEDI